MCRSNFSTCSWCGNTAFSPEERLFTKANREGMASTAGYIYCVDCAVKYEIRKNLFPQPIEEIQGPKKHFFEAVDKRMISQ